MEEFQEDYTVDIFHDFFNQISSHSLPPQFFLELIAILTLVAVVNYWLLIPTFIMSLLFYGLRHIYVHTARSIKRIEAMSKYSYTLTYIYDDEVMEFSCIMYALYQHSIMTPTIKIHETYVSYLTELMSRIVPKQNNNNEKRKGDDMMNKCNLYFSTKSNIFPCKFNISRINDDTCI